MYSFADRRTESFEANISDTATIQKYSEGFWSELYVLREMEGHLFEGSETMADSGRNNSNTFVSDVITSRKRIKLELKKGKIEVWYRKKLINSLKKTCFQNESKMKGMTYPAKLRVILLRSLRFLVILGTNDLTDLSVTFLQLYKKS